VPHDSELPGRAGQLAQAPVYLMCTVQAWAFSTLLPSALRDLPACGFRLRNDFSHDRHCDEDQCVDVAAIAGTLMLPTPIAAVTAIAAARFDESILTSWVVGALRSAYPCSPA
jgi:hypothetical protein